jgi:hypothetical protein
MLGTDQLDKWAKTLAEADELYRELQLLVRINPEAYRVDDDTIAAVGAANADAWDDGGMIHPLVFAKTWAWHLAGEARSIPPVTSNWATLIRYISANLQYLDGEDREVFSTELRRLRGAAGAWVNENGLSQGEAEDLADLNAHEARKAFRRWALTSDRTMKRKDLAKAFPGLTENDWHALRMRKVRSDEDIPAYHYPVRWVAEIAPEDDAPIPRWNKREAYRDVMDVRPHPVSLDALAEESYYVDPKSGLLVDSRRGKRQTQEAPEDL